jgi:hypothetical protein
MGQGNITSSDQGRADHRTRSTTTVRDSRLSEKAEAVTGPDYRI